MSSRTCSLCSGASALTRGVSCQSGDSRTRYRSRASSGQGHPFFALLVFRARDVGSQQELDRLEIVVQPLPRGDGFNRVCWASWSALIRAR